MRHQSGNHVDSTIVFVKLYVLPVKKNIYNHVQTKRSADLLSAFNIEHSVQRIMWHKICENGQKKCNSFMEMLLNILFILSIHFIYNFYF